jgi:hypothetical protein
MNAAAQSGPSEAEISAFIADHPDDLSGPQPTHSHKGYQRFDLPARRDLAAVRIS